MNLRSGEPTMGLICFGGMVKKYTAGCLEGGRPILGATNHSRIGSRYSNGRVISPCQYES